MNYCTKCMSYYARPGTCNCFAVVREVSPPPPSLIPYISIPPLSPGNLPTTYTSSGTFWGKFSSLEKLGMNTAQKSNE